MSGTERKNGSKPPRKRGPGRPKKQPVSPPKPPGVPKEPDHIRVAKAFLRQSGLFTICVLGKDDYTEALIEEAWKNPNISIIYADYDEAVETYMNRKMINRSFSMTRWEIVSARNLIPVPPTDKIFVAEHYMEQAQAADNPYGVKLINMKDYK